MVDDRAYWNEFYSKTHQEIEKPSLFAQFVYNEYLQDRKGAKIVEFGCGNGRDSIYFAKNGLNVTGIDSSVVSINNLQKYQGIGAFVCADFTSELELYKDGFDFCYSRFTLHAINDEQEISLFQNVAKMLKQNGMFFIEARSIKDGKFGIGNALSEREFILDGHYRRFIDKNILRTNLEKYNFNIVKLAESADFAPSKDEKCVCVRVIAKLR